MFFYRLRPRRQPAVDNWFYIFSAIKLETGWNLHKKRLLKSVHAWSRSSVEYLIAILQFSRRSCSELLIIFYERPADNFLLPLHGAIKTEFGIKFCEINSPNSDCDYFIFPAKLSRCLRSIIIPDFGALLTAFTGHILKCEWSLLPDFKDHRRDNKINHWDKKPQLNVQQFSFPRTRPIPAVNSPQQEIILCLPSASQR